VIEPRRESAAAPGLLVDAYDEDVVQDETRVVLRLDPDSPP